MIDFATHITIEATPQRIWQILTDGAAYPSWNTTVERVEGTIAANETITVRAKVAPGKSFPVKVDVFDAPSRMVWNAGMPLGLFKGERTFTLAPGIDGVDFAMREVYTGLLAPLITKSIPDLQPAFDEFAACLKVRAETS